MSRSPTRPASRLGITWSLSPVHGWGVFGLNLCRELVSRQNAPQPALFRPAPSHLLSNTDRPRLASLIAEQDSRTRPASAPETLGDHAMLYSLENGLAPNAVADLWRGGMNAGVTFFEGTDFDTGTKARIAWLDAIVAGSTWNADILKANGIGPVVLAPQGVDTETFCPGPKRGLFGDRFVVFSGGKAEYRKGQDIVLEAFRRFHARRPESVLVTLWRNPWPESAATLAENPFGFGAPDAADGDAAMARWAARAGIPEGAFIDLGFVRNDETVQVLREADVCIFPNRCEGGTNLVAMEAMATGAPCALSANTGHLDLLMGNGEARAYPLTGAAATSSGRDGWSSIDPDAVVAALDAAYDDRAAARAKGDAAHVFMQTWSWRHQVDRLMTGLGLA